MMDFLDEHLDTSSCAKLEARLLLMQGSDEDITHARDIISSLLEQSGLEIQDELMQIHPPKDWSTSRDGGRRKIIRKDLQKPELDDAGK